MDVIYLIEGETLTSLADAIREKTGDADDLTLSEMRSSIEGYSAKDTSAEIVDGSVTVFENDKITIIGGYAFYSCSSLTTVSFPVATSIGASAFCHCSKLTTAIFPACTSIGNYAFYVCRNLTTVSFPVAMSIGSQAFYSCRNLTTVSFPVATSIGASAFYSCSKLTTAIFPACTSIGSYAFNRCYSLTTFILSGSSVCTLVNSNAFSSTPIASGTGTIYVPSSLVATYQAATNWTYFSSRISGI